VLQALGGEGEYGGGEAAGEEVPALGGQLADGQALGVRREALEAVVDVFRRQAGDGFGRFVDFFIGHTVIFDAVLQYLQSSLRMSHAAV
jgi:hypothetical protein